MSLFDKNEIWTQKQSCLGRRWLLPNQGEKPEIDASSKQQLELVMEQQTGSK